jgi:hypothetical protein
MITMLKTPILKVNLNTFFKNASTNTICPILQNELQVDEILIYIKFQVTEDLKKYLCIVKLCIL